MGFFDLNIPFSEPSTAAQSHAARVKLATAAMELGYSGVAYNRTIKGVMSERDRCPITPLTLDSLLKLSPSLSSSVQFHRDRLGVPRAAPFRQYTRLTVVLETLPQALALNSGNPILKSYDLVSVKPLNQTVFDHACERSEVDIIAIDFSEKSPFRLKLPMVKAAIQRGVYFEIAYSGFLADMQSRRQLIANAKLLVDWTRGKNLIISSAASSVYDLRGPYDVANLSSLLGLSMERAKAAVSKNCRALITKALRKKQFHKEAVKVESMSLGEPANFDKPLSGYLLKWDPISSGDGDLVLEDLAKSFAATSNVSKNVKSIDSFLLKDAVYGDKVIHDSPSLENGKSANFVALATELPVSAGRLNLPEVLVTPLEKTPFKHQASLSQGSHILYPCETTKTLSNANNPSQSSVNFEFKTPIHDLQLRKCDNTNKSHEASVPSETLRGIGSDMVLDTTPSEREQTYTPSRVLDFHPVEEENLRADYSIQESIGDHPMDEDSTGLDNKHREKSLPSMNFSFPESLTENEQLEELQKDPLRDCVTVEHNLTSVNDESHNVTTVDQRNVVTAAKSTPGKSNAKRKRHRQRTLLFPVKLKLTPSSFKKRRISKNKTKRA